MSHVKSSGWLDEYDDCERPADDNHVRLPLPYDTSSVADPIALEGACIADVE